VVKIPGQRCWSAGYYIGADIGFACMIEACLVVRISFCVRERASSSFMAVFGISIVDARTVMCHNRVSRIGDRNSIGHGHVMRFIGRNLESWVGAV